MKAVGTEELPLGYTVRAPLGQDRLGRSLLCQDDGAGLQGVLRVMDAAPREGRARVEAETELAAAAAASRHPCAVPIEAVWFDERAGLCLRQRHYAGGSAQALLDAGAVWETDDAVVLGIRAAAALAYSHRIGVLHLDVRPHNLFADDAGNWSLANGGVAAALNGAALAFDSRYAARELMGWEQPGPAADVYGLGATLGALLSTPPPALAALLDRMTAADPSARPPLAEVDRVLRNVVSRAAMARLPAPEGPAATALVPLPVRQLATVVPQTGGDERNRRGRLIAAVVTVAAVFVAAATLTVATLDGDDESPSDADGQTVSDATALADTTSDDATAPEAGAPDAPGKGVASVANDGAERPEEAAKSTRPATQAASKPVSPSALGPASFTGPSPGEHQPTGIAFEIRPNGNVIRWTRPVLHQGLVGYLVVLTSRDRKVQARQFVPPRQLLAVFGSPPLNDGSCVSVGALYDNGKTVTVAANKKPNCDVIRAQFAKKRR